jgi:hypothetical protein
MHGSQTMDFVRPESGISRFRLQVALYWCFLMATAFRESTLCWHIGVAGLVE